MKSLLLLAVSISSACLMFSCNGRKKGLPGPLKIASGQMPNIAKDNSRELHLVYGTGDSIMYLSSSDEGNTFSAPSLISVLPDLMASHTRGPQIVCSDNGLTVIAANGSGNIFSYLKETSGNWKAAVRVNDIDTVSKEGLMALSADGQNTFAVWLDLRDKHNKIFGAKSNDGGKSWSKNILVYASPDTTVCECCKPSVAVKGDKVFVMFRNWLHGNRDLYLAQSTDGGNTFSQVNKLGTGSWTLNGCPMDGGGLVVNKNDIAQTVWRRESKIYTAEPGKAETEIGEGRSCTIEIIAGQSVYAWTEKGNVVCLLPNGKKEILGKGQLPVIKAIDNTQLICVWEHDKEIYRSVLKIL